MAGGQLHIDEMYAFIQMDPSDNTEGVIAFMTKEGWMPMVGADMRRVGFLMPRAQEVANATGRPVQLVKFSLREEIEVIEPDE